MLNDIANKLECSIGEYDVVCVGGNTIFNMLYEDKQNLIKLEVQDALFSNAVGMLQQLKKHC